jgi:hypothetical protein
MGVGAHELVIDDDNWEQFVEPDVDGHRVHRGLVPRDFSAQPVGSSPLSFDAVNMPLIPRSEWSDRIKEMEATKSRLSDIRRTAVAGGPIPSLDQNGQGYCWSYSTGMAIMLARAVMNQPYARLSPHAVAAKIKGFRDQGGWAALSMEFAVKYGYPTDDFWPQKSMSRQYDNQKTWDNAKLYQVTEGWWDLGQSIYDRNLTFDQVMTCLLCRVPVATDFRWWGHSVCSMDPVEVEKGSFGIRIINSWSDKWGDMGEAVLRGDKAVPVGAVAPRVVDASAA